jgi:membrane associated rhomboid family serine protease
MLASWIVWLIFRWKKIPVECKSQRNCQLIVVVSSVTLTLAMSFGDLIDWGAHFGGFVSDCLIIYLIAN